MPGRSEIPFREGGKVEGAEEQQVLGCVLSAFVKISTTIHIHGVPVCVQRSQGKVQVTHVYCV